MAWVATRFVARQAPAESIGLAVNTCCAYVPLQGIGTQTVCCVQNGDGRASHSLMLTSLISTRQR